MKENSEGLRNNKEKGNLQKQEGGWKDFEKLLRKKALKLILNKENYTNSTKCQICKKIAVMTFFISFRLYEDKERTQFITFHSKCVFKKSSFLFKNFFFNKLDKILQTFDYIAEV